MRSARAVGACLALVFTVSLAGAAQYKDQHELSSPAILNPGNIPPWFQTGKFRSARWDGGPIEAEKGLLTGWTYYTPNDPRQVLRATRDWYNPRTIEFLKLAHINWAWVTWSVGFSPATERQQQDLVARYIKAYHQNAIRVAVYISIGNMFWRDMFQHLPASISWVRRDNLGAPVFYSPPNRYMADIQNAAWVELQTHRVEAAVRAGADALWIDNTFSYYHPQDVSHLISVLYEAAYRINPHFVIMSNYNRDILTWGRFQNGVTTEDGREPGYYPEDGTVSWVANAGLLRYNYAVGEGWRPVSLEDGGRHQGDRITTPMHTRKWQLAIAECAMYHVSFELYFEGILLRDIYFREPRALQALRAMGSYNSFLEQNERYYTKPRSLSQAAVLCDSTDAVVPYLDKISEQNLNYDVIFNYQSPQKAGLARYKVILLPNTNPLSKSWCATLAKWVHDDGGTLIAVSGASLFPSGPALGVQDFGLGTLLGISKRNLPRSAQVHSTGKGSTVYLPDLPPANKMASLIRRYIGDSEPVEVEPHVATLSSVSYQPEHHRIVLHLLNYRQVLEKQIHVKVRASVRSVQILSPDPLIETKPLVQNRGGSCEIVVPELQTYDLIAIDLSGKGDAAYDFR